MTAVPVVPGKVSAVVFNVPDGRAWDPCAACNQGGDYRGQRSLERYDGVRLMLCIDWRSCNRRWRAAA